MFLLTSYHPPFVLFAFIMAAGNMVTKVAKRTDPLLGRLAAFLTAVVTPSQTLLHFLSPPLSSVLCIFLLNPNISPFCKLPEWSPKPVDVHSLMTSLEVVLFPWTQMSVNTVSLVSLSANFFLTWPAVKLSCTTVGYRPVLKGEAVRWVGEWSIYSKGVLFGLQRRIPG